MVLICIEKIIFEYLEQYNIWISFLKKNVRKSAVKERFICKKNLQKSSCLYSDIMSFHAWYIDEGGGH